MMRFVVTGLHAATGTEPMIVEIDETRLCDAVRHQIAPLVAGFAQRKEMSVRLLRESIKAFLPFLLESLNESIAHSPLAYPQSDIKEAIRTKTDCIGYSADYLIGLCCHLLALQEWELTTHETASGTYLADAIAPRLPDASRLDHESTEVVASGE